LAGNAGVYALPENVKHELDPSAVSPSKLIAARFTNDHERNAEVGDHVPCAEPSDLLLNGARDIDVSGGTRTFGEELSYSINLGGKRPLDVHGSPPPNLAVVYLSLERRIGPSAGVAHIHVVEMGVEHDRGGLASTPNEAEEVSRFIGMDLVVSQLLHLAANHLGELAFSARQALGLDQALCELNTSADIHQGSPPQPTLRHEVDRKASQPVSTFIMLSRHGGQSGFSMTKGKKRTIFRS
jgi:hypothetical protein